MTRASLGEGRRSFISILSISLSVGDSSKPERLSLFDEDLRLSLFTDEELEDGRRAEGEPELACLAERVPEIPRRVEEE